MMCTIELSNFMSLKSIDAVQWSEDSFPLIKCLSRKEGQIGSSFNLRGTKLLSHSPKLKSEDAFPQ